MVTDLSQDKPPGIEEIKPLDLSAPTFIMVAEDKGSIKRPNVDQDQDPEPNEEEWLKSIGATLISKKIQV